MRFISESLSKSSELFHHVNFSVKKIANLRDIVSITKSSVWSPIIWKDGQRRAANFAFSDYAVLDFDNSMQLPEAFDTFKDYQCFIATTMSHQKKKNGHVSDRFRVVIPWEKRITDYQLFRANMQQITRHYESDTDCIDGGRLYKPSPEVVFFNEGELMEVKDIKPAEQYSSNVIAMAPPQNMPGWLQDLINRGSDGHPGRNAAGFKIAAAMLRTGYREQEILAALKKSFGVCDLPDSELTRVVKSAKKSTLR